MAFEIIQLNIMKGDLTVQGRVRKIMIFVLITT